MTPLLFAKCHYVPKLQPQANQGGDFTDDRKEQIDLRIYRFMYFCMNLTITSTEAVRSFGDCLARIKHRGDTFVITKNRRPVAKLTAANETEVATVGELFDLLRHSPPADAAYVSDLEHANSKELPSNPWAS